ncbi:MAG: ArsR/SmtB family transcription factor [Solirubrobacteraceae bacterium]
MREACPPTTISSTLPQPVIDRVAERFRLLADPSRLRVINELHASGELSVGELVGRSGLAYATVSKHLALLRAHGSLLRRRDGTRIFYMISDPWIGELCEVVCKSLRSDWASWGVALEAMPSALGPDGFEEPADRLSNIEETRR